MPKKRSTRAFSVFLMIVNTVAWGAALPIVKPALEFITPYEFLLYRYIFASVCSLPLLIYYLPKVRHKAKAISQITLMELVGTTIALGLLYLGLSKTSSLEASMIATTTPLFITIGGILFLKEKEEKHEWLGLILAIIGTTLLTIEPLLFGKVTLSTFSPIGNILVFLQNIATAAYFLLAKKIYKNIPKLFITTISYYVGIVSFLLLVMFENSTFSLQLMLQHLSVPAVFFAVLYMATFGSIIGLTAYIKGQEGMEASEASLFTYLQPIVFIPLSVLWLHESIHWLSILATVIIFAGVWLAESKPKHRT